MWYAIGAGAAVLVLLALVTWMWMRRRRTARMRDRFGQEYDHEVKERGRGKAERELNDREKRVKQLSITPLDRDDRDRLVRSWRMAQERFVDDPRSAVGHADLLITEVMQLRGYPMADFEQRAADVSVDHPAVVANYRSAHAISVADAQGKATTEQLRQAMVQFRSLFQDLLEVGEDAESPAPPSRN
ncbi:MAG: hypothetical protein IT303_15430 [Dehalococcoidia bacterium]|nr:hypothetical protein [Dehalococcoidia bacterium]